MYGKYGITPTNAMTINVYDIDNVLVRSFTSQVEAAEWLGVSNVTVHNYIKSGIPMETEIYLWVAKQGGVRKST